MLRNVRGEPATSRSRARLALPLLVATVLTAAGCSLGGSAEEPAPHQALKPFPCTDGSDWLCIEADGERAWVPSGTVDLSAPVTLIDLGGPGQDPLNQASLAPLLTTGTNAVVPLEPWVTEPPGEACRTAMSTYVTAVREQGAAARARTAAEFADACSASLAAEADHTRDGIDTFVGLLRQAGVERVDAVAVSFGAERVLRATEKLDSVVLISPYVAVRPVAEVSVARQDAAEQVALSRPGDADLHARVERTLPRSLPGRSVPFTAVDLSSAVASVAYDPEAARPALLDDLRTLDTGEPGDEQLWVATAADRLSGRYGVREHFMGLVGYFGGVCAASPAATTVPAPEQRSRFLEAFHVACDEVDSLPVTDESEVSGCVLLSSSDPVALRPVDVVARFPRMTVVDHAEAGHVSESSLGRALEILAAHRRGDTGCSA